MSTNIGGNPALWPVLFPIPSDGDAPNAASVNGAFVALANRTANLKQWQTDLIGNLVWNQDRGFSAGPISIVSAAGTPPGTNPGAYSVAVLNNAHEISFRADFSFDLYMVSTDAVARLVSFAFDHADGAGAGAVTLSGASVLQCTPNQTTRQRVHLVTWGTIAANSGDRYIRLRSGKDPALNTAEIRNISAIGLEVFSL